MFVFLQPIDIRVYSLVYTTVLPVIYEYMPRHATLFCKDIRRYCAILRMHCDIFKSCLHIGQYATFTSSPATKLNENQRSPLGKFGTLLERTFGLRLSIFTRTFAIDYTETLCMLAGRFYLSRDCSTSPFKCLRVHVEPSN